jgi:chemosensory pili system protein ChpC
VSDAVEELYSLLIPLAEDRLIVPRACVAEVVRFIEPEDSPGSADWYLGTVNWNGRQLPVVAFEGMIGGDIPMMTARTRIVVFYASSGNLRGGFFGILTQGFPQLVRVNREVLKLDKSVELPENSPVFCRVKMINEYPLIPDLEGIEERLSEIELQV